MARRYSGAKGKSGSTKPDVMTNPSWQTHKPAEVEKLIEKLAKEELSPSKIGLVLRDRFGIPDVKTICGKTITQILNEKKIGGEIPEDLQSLIRRSVVIRKHLEANHLDEPARRGLLLTESKIGRLVKYYKRTGKLAMTWKWIPSQASKYLE